MKERLAMVVGSVVAEVMAQLMMRLEPSHVFVLRNSAPRGTNLRHQVAKLGF